MKKNYRVDDIENKIRQAGFIPLDVLLVGATGVGKSSTLNALFGKEVSKVGTGVNPETMLVKHYELNNVLRIWDSPGFGDGKEADKEHTKKIIDILYKTYTHEDGTWGFIDLVLVILDGSLRDMGTTYRLLENVILPNMQPERVMVAINQCDLAMKGRYWNSEQHCPEPELTAFLEEKALSVQSRLLEATGLKIRKPVYYSAQENYHVDKFMDSLIKHIPNQKRKLMGGR